MNTLVIRNGKVVNDGKIVEADIIIHDDIIYDIVPQAKGIYDHEIDARGKFVIPGVIDDQVHFREPGLTHKAEIYSESRAAIAGGITSFMEMPNTVPNTLTQALLEEKYNIAAANSMANYSFFMGVSNNNLEEVLKTNNENVCGVKIFMGSSTGNMLVDNIQTLEHVFAKCDTLIATHCEDEATIKNNLAAFKEKFGENIPVESHPLIRSNQACFLSSSAAVALAEKNNTRLHVLHISTREETVLFDNKLKLRDKKITAEVCIHHLWFTNADYKTKGNWIKWNPAVKTANDKEAIWKALLNDRFDIIATDHAPHTIEEKMQPYLLAPSGGPLVQHALPAMLQFVNQKKITIEKLVEKMCHAPADCFRLVKRGYLRPGYFADVVLVDMHMNYEVNKTNILYKCGWSPFEGEKFTGGVHATILNGKLVYKDGKFDEHSRGKRLTFEKIRK